ncbi:MAG: DUF5777 family beta-barrel protein [Acidobacteriota bacterium]
MIYRIFVVLLVLAGMSQGQADAMPPFLEAFDADPLSNPTWRTKCATCHLDPAGAGPRNSFGQAFDKAGKTITPMLRAQFSDRFLYPQIVVAADTRIHHSDPDRKTVILQQASQYIVVAPGDPPAITSPGLPVASSPVIVAAMESGPRRARHLELANRVINLPALNPLPRGYVEVNIAHRFADPAFKGTASDLFGLDGFANISFGVDVAVTDSIRVGISRTRFGKDIELDAHALAFRQNEKFPISLGFRAGLEGRENFHDRYSGSLQIITARNFDDRFQVYFTPTFVFNARDSQPEFLRRFGVGPNENHTVALGVGGDLAIRPTVSLLGEWVPRVAGWRGIFEDRSTVSFGIKKSTFRHAFVLTLSKSADITPTGYAVNSPSGTLGFKIGFNIYRRLH